MKSDNFNFSVLKVKILKIQLLLFILFITTNIAFGQFSFAAYKAYHTGSFAEVVCIGDINNDGLNDVVLGTSEYFDTINDFKIFVYLQDKLGNLSAPIKYKYPEINDGINTIAIGDVNNDNLNDVIIGYADSIGIFYQNQSGTLNPVQTIFSGIAGNSSVGYKLALSVGDLNNDGLNDIAVAHSGQIVISILYQKKNNGFSTLLYPYSGNSQIEIADINDDQLNDIVFITCNGIGTLTQNSSGILDNYQSYTNPNKYNESFAVADLNNDGIYDVAEIGDYDSLSYLYYEIALFYQNYISHRFQPPIQIKTYWGGEAIKIADLNCDGKNEIISANGGYIEIFNKNINNIYQLNSKFTNPYATHYNPQAMAVGDINNDNKKDIVIANYNYGLVIFRNQSVLLGNCCTMPLKPSKPIGDNVICMDNDTSIYKKLISNSNNTLWQLFPTQAGKIISKNNDSCLITWDNSWRGKSGIFLKATNSCGSAYSDTLIVTINRLPKVNLGNDTTLCLKDTIILSAGKGSNSSYKWQNNSIDSVFTVKSAGIYFLKSTNVCGVTTDSIIIQSLPLPNINLCKDTVLCSGTFIQFDVSISGNNNYLWQDNSIKPVYNISKPGIYSVTVMDSNNCHNNKSVLVRGISKPSVYLPNDTTYCGTINLKININCPNCQYLWQDNTTDSFYNITQAGLYTLTLSNVCGKAIDSIDVNELPMPRIDIPVDTFFCKGNILILDVKQQGNFPFHYLWQDSSTESAFNITSKGIYTVIVSDSNLCQISKTINVEEFTLPYINFPEDTTFCSSSECTLNALNIASTYLWQDSSTSPQYIVQKSGIYAVKVNNICGSVSDTTNVIKTDCISFLIPSAFTPNGDGLNDIFKAESLNVFTKFQLSVYNRLYQLIFESTDINIGWDGTFKNKPVPDGVYFYLIVVIIKDTVEPISKTGNVTVLR